MPSTIRLVAAAAQNFGGQRLRVGEEFATDLSTAMDLMACGLASIVQQEETIFEEDSPEPELPALLMKKIKEKAPRKKRTYKRRDMESE